MSANVSPGRHGRRGISRLQFTVALLSAVVLFLDGFDTQVVSYAAPMIAREWRLPPATLGPIFSSALVGLMVGYLALSPLSDRFGSKRIAVLSTAAFGLFTLATVAAGSLPELVALRFLTGVVLGAAAPAVVTLTDEYSPRHMRATFVLAIYCGFALGFVAAGFAAAELLPNHGWRSLFWIGAALPLLLCPVLVAILPESLAFLTRSGKPASQVAAMRRDAGLDTAEADSHLIPGSRPPAVFDFLREGRAPGTVLLWLVFAINLAAFYLLQSWLPTLLTRLHRDLATTAAATSLISAGGIAATFVIGPAMDRLGACRSLAMAYGAGAVGAALLGPALPAQAWQLYLASFCAGFCIAGGQKSAIALATLFYPLPVRSTGLGWALGIGRAGGIGGPVLAGLLLGAGWSPAGLFYVVAVGMLVAAAATVAIGNPRVSGLVQAGRI